MPCNVIQTPKGAVIACSRGPRPEHRCVTCGFSAYYLCDFVLGSGKTCDAPMCREHRHWVAPGRDYCHTHALVANVGKTSRPEFGEVHD